MKEIKRVCILGLDALEYDLVEKLDLKNLKQREYGKVELPIKPHERPSTAIIWPTFITGKRPEEHGRKTDRKWDSWFIRSFSKFKKFCKRRLNLKFFPKFIDKTLAINLGFKYRTFEPKDMKEKTIFDSVDESVALSIPGYSEWNEIIDARNLNFRAKKGEISHSEAKENVVKIFEKKKKAMFDKLETENWRLFMIHIFVLDTLQHLYYYDEDFIKNWYEKMNEFVESVEKKLDEDTLLLIIADHGQKNGTHTRYGFYSSNKELKLNSPNMTYFYDLIKEIFKTPGEE